jgi:hypothetical protein
MFVEELVINPSRTQGFLICYKKYSQYTFRGRTQILLIIFEKYLTTYLSKLLQISRIVLKKFHRNFRKRSRTLPIPEKSLIYSCIS